MLHHTRARRNAAPDAETILLELIHPPGVIYDRNSISVISRQEKPAQQQGEVER
jgi:hypothetical protein